MGSSDSKAEKEEKEEVSIAPDPLINRLRKTLRLQLNQSGHQTTYSFLHQSFSQQITKNRQGRISEDYSPFCCILLPDKKEQLTSITTCAILSPILAIAPLSRLADPSGFLYNEKLSLHGVCGGKKSKQKVKRIMVVKELGIALLILSLPIWELGWCGVTFLARSDEIGNAPVFSIFNVFSENMKQTIPQAEEPLISQKMEKVYCKQAAQFQGKSSRAGQNLLVKVIDRKPYIVGVQNGESCLFFTAEAVAAFQGRLEEYLKPDLERQILKEIDIEKLEIESSW